MKNVFYCSLLFGLLALTCCQKEESQVIDAELTTNLSEKQKVLKSNLDKAAKLMAQVLYKPEIKKELSQLHKAGADVNKIYFRDLFESNIKSEGLCFSNLKNRLSQTLYTKVDGERLLEYLISNNCYLYLPYPIEWYESNADLTIAAHPIDNTDNGIGYRIENNDLQSVTVNETYANSSPLVIIMPDEMPIDDEFDIGGGAGSESNPDPIFGTFGTGPNSINTVYIGWVRLADYCGGIFEGDIELRIKRIQPNWDPVALSPYATEPVELHINYPRSYAKAAVNNWTQYCNGGWLKVNATWDTNWSLEEFQQGIIAYDYDWDASIRKTSISLTYKGVGFTVSFEKDSKYEGDFLGKNNEWYRDWFYQTNLNPTPFDEVYKGWTVRCFGSLKFTTPHYTLYY